MIKKFYLLLFVFGLITSGYSQGPLWTKTTKERLASADKVDRASVPVVYQLFHLDLNQLKARLQNAPSRSGQQLSDVIIPFPDGNGQLKNFRIYNASIMAPELAAQHPDIQSYTGRGVDDPTLTIRFSVTLFGLHNMMFSDEGTSFTDPYTKDHQNYIVYKRKDLKPGEGDAFVCHVNEDEGQTAHRDSGLAPMSTESNDGVLRTYRLAMACTIEYAAFQVNQAGVGSGTLQQKKDAVLAAMNVTMTRVNGVYEKDLAITMVFIPNEEDIIFITSDNFNNDNANMLISQSQSVIDGYIGSSNYDIGHTVSTGGGGLASLGCVCTSFKAQGITGSPQPVGDPFDIDYVAHEMGHQFGANHTFNGNTGSCGGGNRNAPTAVEPGSGTTIMAYAGICPGGDVQEHSDDYFHTVSLDQMFSYINSGGDCAVITPNNNNAPVIASLQSYTIPKTTPFVLTASATDADGDALTYCWEQTNANGVAQSTPLPTNTSGPNFRSFSPTASPSRYFPKLQDVLNGNLITTWEVLSSVSRIMNFAVTVRDNALANGGQTARKNMNITVTANAGPFEVTSQNTENTVWEQGSQQTITWNVAGTTGNGVNTSQVNILLSTDGGQTFDTVLASATPNDGTETITVPSIEAPFCRIMVQAVGNVYYAVNSTPFSVGVSVVTDCTTYTNNTSASIPDGANSFSVSSISVPENVTVNTVNVGMNITHSWVSDLYLVLQSPQGTQVSLWEGECADNNNINVTFSDSGTDVVCGSPTTGTILPQEPLSALNGESSQGNWLLGYIDVQNGDAGTLNSWSVEICTQTVGAISSYGLKDFTLYPNPNNGSFTVGFTSETGNAVDVVVNDMRGRQIYSRSFANTGLFSANINLTDVQRGVYLVTVNDGARREVRKIVIK